MLPSNSIVFHSLIVGYLKGFHYESFLNLILLSAASEVTPDSQFVLSMGPSSSWKSVLPSELRAKYEF